MQNGDWKQYKYRRDQDYIKSVLSSSDTEKNQYSEESVKAVALLHMNMGAVSNRMGRRNAQKQDSYIIKDEYMNILPFEADFKMRGSSVPAFIEGLSNDKNFLFEIEKVQIVAINDSEPDKKDGRSNEEHLLPERELPLDVHIKGRIITFDFKRLFEKSEKTSSASRKKTGSRTKKTHR